MLSYIFPKFVLQNHFGVDTQRNHLQETTSFLKYVVGCECLCSSVFHFTSSGVSSSSEWVSLLIDKEVDRSSDISSETAATGDVFVRY